MLFYYICFFSFNLREQRWLYGLIPNAINLEWTCCEDIQSWPFTMNLNLVLHLRIIIYNALFKMYILKCIYDRTMEMLFTNLYEHTLVVWLILVGFPQDGVLKIIHGATKLPRIWCFLVHFLKPAYFSMYFHGKLLRLQQFWQLPVSMLVIHYY